jgi:hypothetical protein
MTYFDMFNSLIMRCLSVLSREIIKNNLFGIEENPWNDKLELEELSW